MHLIVLSKKFIQQILRYHIAIIFLLFFSTVTPVQSAVHSLQEKNSLRIEFEIGKLNDYTIEQQNKKVHLTFNQPVEHQLAETQERYPQILKKYEVSDDKKVFVIELTQDTAINHYREGNKLIINIPLSTPTETQKMNPEGLEGAELSYSANDKFSRFSFHFDTIPPYEIKQNAKNTQIIFKKPYKFATQNLINYPKYNQISFKQESPEKYIFTIPAITQRSFEQSNQIVIDVSPTEKSSKEEELTDISNAPLLKIRSLSFSWNKPVNIAAFKRGEHLWIVFDQYQNLDIAALNKEIIPLAKNLYQLPNPQATIIRLTPEKDIKVNLRKEGLLWIVDLYTGGKDMETEEIPIYTRYDALNHSYLYAPLNNVGNIISIFDPDIGDVISIVPTDTTNVGINHAYQYPDLDFIETINGLALIYKSDDIEITRGTNGINIRKLQGNLNISAELDELKRRNLLYGDNNIDKQFVMNIPAEILNKPFLEAVKLLEQDIITSDSQDTNKIRLREAGYFLNRGLGSNAIKILNSLEKEKASESESDTFHSMRGIANFLMRRYEEAIKDFSHGNLVKNEEAQFWKNLCIAALQPNERSNEVISPYIYMLKNYPNEIRRRIALVAIEPALMANDDLAVQNYIEILRDSDGTDNKAAINYYNARRLEAMGYPLNALREYRNAADSSANYYSVLSRKKIIEIQKKTNTISLSKAAEEYEKLRYAWGEAEFKIKVLQELAEIYAQNKDYPQALKTLKEAKNLGLSKDSEAITRRMVKFFEDIYYYNQDDKMPAIQSLALYQDYHELAPQSQYYNEIVQKLADRLVAVDLLGRAYNILSHQMENGKLTANEAGTIGTRMALINLFNNEPEKAIENLDKTESDELSPSIVAHRRIIRAKALSGLGKTEEALELLKEDYSRNGILLKAEIFWNNQQWGDAADNIKYLIEKPQEGKALSQEQIQLILEWATALKKAGRETVIVRLKNTFEPYFATTPYISIFNVLTDTMETETIDLHNIDETINNIADFRNFAKIYTDSMQKSSLSETIK